MEHEQVMELEDIIELGRDYVVVYDEPETCREVFLAKGDVELWGAVSQLISRDLWAVPGSMREGLRKLIAKGDVAQAFREFSEWVAEEIPGASMQIYFRREATSSTECFKLAASEFQEDVSESRKEITGSAE